MIDTVVSIDSIQRYKNYCNENIVNHKYLYNSLIHLYKFYFLNEYTLIVVLNQYKSINGYQIDYSNIITGPLRNQNTHYSKLYTVYSIYTVYGYKHEFSYSPSNPPTI